MMIYLSNFSNFIKNQLTSRLSIANHKFNKIGKLKPKKGFYNKNINSNDYFYEPIFWDFYTLKMNKDFLPIKYIIFRNPSQQYQKKVLFIQKNLIFYKKISANIQILIENQQFCMKRRGIGQNSNESSGKIQGLSIKSCRICLLQMNSDKKTEKLISPCLCSGTLEYVHPSCLKKWLQKRLKGEKTDFLCEICQHKLNFYVLFTYKLFEWKQFKENIKQKQTTFLIKICILFLILAVMVITGLLFQVQNSGKASDFVFYLSITALILTPIFTLAWIIGFIFVFLLKKELKVSQIIQYRNENMQQSQHQIKEKQF